ncbi:hypothetical protein RB653_004207 [Dictyostelium firmibasis]|uniref:Dickkopf N-terminal cysteine-rich domain-containing protein n=1 Tax=Dictyostelium firmibasis TaxID=79012 RepID=A0AAN7YZV3_9MYCE
MKLIFSIVLIIVIVNISHCINNQESKCYKLGERCEHSGRIDLSCGEGLACLPLDSEYVCQPRLKLGEKCFESPVEVCEKGLECLPLNIDEYYSNFTCMSANYAGVGEECNTDSQCIGMGKMGVSCIDSKCKLFSNETSSYEKIKCLNYLSCPGSQICTYIGCEDSFENCSSKCEPLVPLGGKCKYLTDCFIGGVCSIDGFCISRYSKNFNESCLDDNECDFGLRCQQSIVYNDSDTSDQYDSIHRCFPIENSTTSNCSEDGCGDNEFCNSATNRCYQSKKYTNECKYAERERDICILSNQCFFSNQFYDFPYFNENSCIMQKCGVETTEAIKQCQAIYSFCD